MPHIALTGATGFIGRHVLAELTARGFDVVAATRGDGTALPQYENVRWVTLDIASAPEQAFERLGMPDTLIHLAWGGLPHYRARHHFETELPAHYSFLRQMVRAGVKSVLVSGTCLEYGLRSGALREDDPTAPVTPYGFAKDALRRQLEFLQRDSGFNLTWARLFFMHGEGQAATSLLPQLQQAVERGDPTFGMSRGDQLRDYLSVAEVARHLVTLALSGKNPGPVNVCSGVPRSVRGLVEQWLSDNDREIALDLGRYPYPDYEPMAFWGARNKLDSVLERQ
ncbi:NAD-dependent epimerase/dehydratase family protein [Paraburkholderia sartisoli]|uniref:dTDP-6-deoxy-L-talose 4-dehydrogenase (NAD+) n=1 Tax=Paraburkholderia sartisoli TaxID=83784 RepID=A0A1H4G2H8_9BURK|nr:NAD(P)-dependent oxidoreductase [Paraburkholderia sartisoli]SEB02932.1 dTDP-6-deoxy-L-talose 4-dehydrogenase (NAD+) [Paraburkholderia sartisoli]